MALVLLGLFLLSQGLIPRCLHRTYKDLLLDMPKSEYIHKSHNVSVLLYHFVFPTKYRRIVFDKKFDSSLVSICEKISLRHEVHFLEIGTDKHHVHFLVQSVPIHSPSSLVKMLKSITARELFKLHPEIRKILWATLAGEVLFGQVDIL